MFDEVAPRIVSSRLSVLLFVLVTTGFFGSFAVYLTHLSASRLLVMLGLIQWILLLKAGSQVVVTTVYRIEIPTTGD